MHSSAQGAFQGGTWSRVGNPGNLGAGHLKTRLPLLFLEKGLDSSGTSKVVVKQLGMLGISMLAAKKAS